VRLLLLLLLLLLQVLEVAVDPAHQGQGIGSALLAHLLHTVRCASVGPATTAAHHRSMRHAQHR
jgi:ribosomal protein S18 acetylase RimI-like enzyme